MGMNTILEMVANDFTTLVIYAFGAVIGIVLLMAFIAAVRSK